MDLPFSELFWNSDKKMHFYPAIDIKNGQFIRLKKGQLDKLTIYGNDPIMQAKKLQMKSIKDINDLKVNLDNYVSYSIRESLGIIVLSFSEDEITIGAMNPNYVKVLEFITKLESEIKIKVKTKQISSDEWEQKYINQDNPIQLNTDSNNQTQNEDSNLISEALPQSNNDKFDFFDSEDEVELDPEDIFDDSEYKEVSDPVIAAVSSILSASNKLGASDIHAEPLEERMRIRYRVDGVLQEVYSLPKARSRAITSRIKVMSKLDIAERRLPQDGAINFKIEGKVVDLRLSILPTANNERIVMRILNKDAGDITLEQLNFDDSDLKNLRKAIHSTQGLVLVTGPTGSGKTTTLYSILKEVSKPHLNILTAEDPVEYELDGVGQVQIKDDIGLNFAAALRSFLRQDPEIILVGEMRDKETVDIGLKAALTGHLVFSTLHTNDAPSTITRLQNMGTPDYLISAACTLVLAQRLARKSCKDCRVPDEDVNPKVLTDLGFTPEHASRVKAQKGKGCPKCKDTGFKGRMGIYEVLNVTKPIKEAILKKATTPELKEIASKEGFQTMADMGRKMIAAGDLNFREFERVLSSS